MNVLSLFDGISCGQLALQRAGIKYDQYFASEIDKHAIKVTQHNFPDTIQLGDVRNVSASQLSQIDLILAGSPCQGFSFAGKGLNFEDPRSKLFFEFARLLKECKPKYFLLENVKMLAEHQAVISRLIGEAPIEINSYLVSAQSRLRLYWTNIGNEPSGLFGDAVSVIRQPRDRGIVLKDILQSDVDSKYNLSEKALARIERKGYSTAKLNPNKAGCLNTKNNSGQLSVDAGTTLIQEGRGFNAGGVFSQKSPSLTSNSWEQNHHLRECFVISDTGNNHSYEARPDKVSAQRAHNGASIDNALFQRNVIQINDSKESGGKQPFQQNRVYSSEGIAPALCRDLSTGSPAISHEYKIRRLTPVECERLQTVPDNYTACISDTQRYKALGNGWTIDVVAHILSYLT